VFRERQKIEGDDNQTAGRDILVNNYYASTAESINNTTIVDEILQYVKSTVSDHTTTKKGLPEKLLKTKAKISKNFRIAKEKEEVMQHFNFSYLKISLIEEKYRTLDNSLQMDIHSQVYSVYQNLKQNKTSIETLRNMFAYFLPPGKDRDPQYVAFANAFVLFFFDDCTIFEKTRQEKSLQITIFDIK
jgi:hypothetical protein